MTRPADRYAVFGNPIAHSKSPMIHTLFAEQTGQSMRYQAKRVPLQGFADALHAFAAGGGKGLNITVPFKQDAFEQASRLSARAQRAGAVNTMVIEDRDSIFGDNTDGVGLVRDLTQNLGLQLDGKRILLLGAGGAVRGVIEALLDKQPACLTIANRTEAKALQLAQDFASLGEINGCGFDGLDNSAAFDIIINGTSASLHGEIPALPESAIGAGGFCYDMMYGAEPTVFLRWAQQQGGAAVSDGLGMLVEQAAEAFRIWRGVMPDTAPVIAAVRRSLSA